jgi:hypothetical protein
MTLNAIIATHPGEHRRAFVNRDGSGRIVGLTRTAA